MQPRPIPVHPIISSHYLISCHLTSSHHQVSDCGVICDHFDGTYIVQWTAIKAKPYQVKIARDNSLQPGDGTPTPNSPFTSVVVAGAFRAVRCSLALFKTAAPRSEPL